MPQADISQRTCMAHPAHMAGWRMAPPAHQSVAASAPWHCRVLVWTAIHRGRQAGQSPALRPPGGRASPTFESSESVLLCSRGDGHWAHQLLLLGSAKAAQTGAEQHSSLAWGKVRQTEPWASRTLYCQPRCQVLWNTPAGSGFAVEKSCSTAAGVPSSHIDAAAGAQACAVLSSALQVLLLVCGGFGKSLCRGSIAFVNCVPL